MAKKKSPKKVETFIHEEASRKYIPTAEYESVIDDKNKTPIKVAYRRRNPDLDPQLVWRGKDLLNWSDLIVQASPLYIQEKVHPKVLIDDLMQHTSEKSIGEEPLQLDLFADFNGIPDEASQTDFYQHEANWTNRMILGDSLHIMTSLAEREGLHGKIQCIYFDPPYGIKFNSNFQWSTTNRDVKDGKMDHITREPEQVKAYRDTWQDGIYSYLTYLRDRLTVAYTLLKESGSIFVQIGDENVHRLRSLIEEIFGEDNFCGQIAFRKTGAFATTLLGQTTDYILWFAKDKTQVKYRPPFTSKTFDEGSGKYYKWVELPNGDRRSLTKEERENIELLPPKSKLFLQSPLSSAGPSNNPFNFNFRGNVYTCDSGSHWKTTETGLRRLKYANRLNAAGYRIYYNRYLDDFALSPLDNVWIDTVAGGYSGKSIYVVQTNTKVVQRCILMSTDPGDLVLDPTCGSGTTAYVAEEWGRRWITCDTSRVALALARARIMGARFPFYLLADSPEGQQKIAEITRTVPSNTPTSGDIGQGFINFRVPHIMLKDIANNSEIDVIWNQYQETLEPLRKKLNKSLGETWEEWEIPRKMETSWAKEIMDTHNLLWETRKSRQREINASIHAKSAYEYLYDKPYEDNKTVRVAGPFTVESLSPHRILGVDEHDELVDPLQTPTSENGDQVEFVNMILENLHTAGVQQAHKEDKIDFTSLVAWPGTYICAEGHFFKGGSETGTEKRAAIFIGPEFGTVSRPDLVAAAREAGDGGFDVLITCAFNYDAHSTEFNQLGSIPVLKARMNADLHMADDLKNTGKGNLFVIFGEPDIDIIDSEENQIRVRINGVDVFHPNTGEVISDGADGIACWFIDTDYNEESFFVRQAYFLGANDPYKSLKTTLKAEINKEAWETLNSDTSRAFDKPESGRIAVKVINHLGDEVMKVFKVD